MSGKVIPFTGVTRLDMPPEHVLEAAKSADLEGVVVVALKNDGSEYFASSYADGGTALWLLERCKAALLSAGES